MLFCALKLFRVPVQRVVAEPAEGGSLLMETRDVLIRRGDRRMIIELQRAAFVGLHPWVTPVLGSRSLW